jgi:hypothetical protein
VPGRETKGFGGGGVSSQVGLIVIALLVGLVAPLGVVAYLAAKDPVPRSCSTGGATSTHFEGAMTWSTPGVLWFADGDLSRARRLIDYAPVRSATPASPSPTASATLTPSVAATVSPGPSAGPSPSASPTPSPIPAPVFEAVAVSADRHIVAFLVSNPPDEPGMVSLRVISPLDPPGTTAQEPGSWPWVRDGGVRSVVSILPDGHVLFTVAHKWDPPETDPVLVGVAEAGSTLKVDETDPQHKFLQTDHAVWPELKDYKLPPALPKLESRVIAPGGRVAGSMTHFVKTLLVDRALHEIVDGHAGSPDTSVVCAGGDPLETVAFAPDGHTVAVVAGGNTELLDLDGGHALATLLRGRVLAWRA